MRLLGALVILLSACDLQPPPTDRGGDRATERPAPAAPAPRQAPIPTPPDEARAQAPAGEMQVSDRCVAISEHIANVLIADTKDATQKAAYTRNRAQIIRRSAEGCTRDGWGDAQVGCYQKATTIAGLQGCHHE